MSASQYSVCMNAHFFTFYFNCMTKCDLYNHTSPEQPYASRKKSGPTILEILEVAYYFGGARSKGFATLRNISKLTFFGKVGHAKSVGFWFYSGI